ncbi:trypsin-like serine peptidase [Bradyrhizobium sp. USDA 223]|uniref:trypsin-like serine peptidase n=1 Tax=Bradyrhizobium sp. USDA 223 TaxID=3156306 RepID=UPI00383566C8
MKLSGRLSPVLVALSVAIHPSHASSPCEDVPKMATEFGVNTIWGKNVQPSAAPTALTLPKDIRWIRVAVKPEYPGADWVLTIRDVKGRPLQSISSSAVVQGHPVWTERLPVNELYFFLDSSDPAAKVRLTEYIAMSATAKRPYYSIQGPKEAWIDLFESPLENVDTLHRRKGDAVGMFVAHSGSNLNGFKVWSCSGFLIANSPKLLFVTNDHCGGPWTIDDRWSGGVCETAVVDFSWDGDLVKREFGCRSAMRDPANDLAVLELSTTQTDAPPKALALRKKPLKDERVSIIHHPASLPKQISLNCKGITDAAAGIDTVNLETDFAHLCDTEGGSSGAPILDDDGFVVGIHHLGFEKDTQGKCDMINKAVNVGRLIEFLASKPELVGVQIK